jgi:hypothetical protein
MTESWIWKNWKGEGGGRGSVEGGRGGSMGEGIWDIPHD